MTVTSPPNRQLAIQKGGQHLTSVGLLPAEYTLADLEHIEEALVHGTSAMRFCRIDHANLVIERIHKEYRRGEISKAERDYRVNSVYVRLGSRYGVKSQSLKAECMAMKHWPYHARIEGLTVGHYSTVPVTIPKEIAKEC